jgi:hypothetical protein
MMMRCYITGNNSQGYSGLLIPFLLVTSFACKFIFFNLTSGLIWGSTPNLKINSNIQIKIVNCLFFGVRKLSCLIYIFVNPMCYFRRIIPAGIIVS